MSPAAVLAWIRLLGEAVGLVRTVRDVVEPCPDTLPSAELEARRGQAAGSAANASQAATTERMRER